MGGKESFAPQGKKRSIAACRDRWKVCLASWYQTLEKNLYVAKILVNGLTLHLNEIKNVPPLSPCRGFDLPCSRFDLPLVASLFHFIFYRLICCVERAKSALYCANEILVELDGFGE